MSCTGEGKVEYESSSAEDTMRIAEEFARRLKPGDVVRLEGDLGAGKTTFVKGLGRSLGVSEARVKSPTFVVMHIYPGSIPLYHFDLYRLEGDDEMDAIGLEDFVFDPHAVTCVEWADKAASFFPSASYRVCIRMREADHRTISIENSAEAAS